MDFAIVFEEEAEEAEEGWAEVTAQFSGIDEDELPLAAGSEG